MKSIIYIAFIAFTTIGIYAQENSQQEMAESTKALATKISQELSFDDDKTLYLYRALYSTEKTRLRAQEQLNDNPEQLDATNQKIETTFYKMLSAKFSENEIASIKQLVVKPE
jgi:hypothetical protein